MRWFSLTSRVLRPVEKGAHRSRNDFKQEVQEKMAEELELKVAAVEPEEVCRWLKGMQHFIRGHFV